MLQIILTSILFIIPLSSNANIYKYVDNNGNNIYSDKAPIKSDSSILSKQGNVKKNSIKENEKKEVVNLEEMQKDKGLLLLYSNVNDIEEAKEIQLKKINEQIKIDSNNLETFYNLRNDMDNERVIFTQQDYQNLNNNINIIKNNIRKNELLIHETKKKYLEDKERFLKIEQEKNKIIKKQNN